jgi:hypothetical protein
MASATLVAHRIRAHGTVRVSLPAKIAYDPKALKASITDLLERLGCPRCFSGADCLFAAERDFVVDPQAVASAVTHLGPQPDPWRVSAATVSLARGVRYDINKVFQAVDKTIDILGQCPCHSGIDVFYRNELTVIGVNEQAEAQQFGG